MKDEALIALWKTADVTPNEETVAEIRARATRERSNNIIVQILRQSRRELGAGILVALLSAFVCRWHYYALLFQAMALFTALGVLLLRQRSLRRQIYRLNQQAPQRAIRAYIDLFSSDRRTLKWTAYLFVGLTFYTSVVLHVVDLDQPVLDGPTLTRLLLGALLGTPFLRGFLRLELEGYLRRHYDAVVERFRELAKAL